MNTSFSDMGREWIDASKFAMIPAWLRTTPLGAPVVPDVNIIEASASGAIVSGAGRSGPAESGDLGP